MDIERTMEFIVEQLAYVAVRQAEGAERLAKMEKLQDRTDRRLDRAIRFAVREARLERAKRRSVHRELNESVSKLNDSITRLAAAQLVTEEKLQRLIEHQSGANGRG